MGLMKDVMPDNALDDLLISSYTLWDVIRVVAWYDNIPEDKSQERVYARMDERAEQERSGNK